MFHRKAVCGFISISRVRLGEGMDENGNKVKRFIT